MSETELQSWFILSIPILLVWILDRFNRNRIHTFYKKCDKRCPNYPGRCRSSTNVSDDGRIWRSNFFLCKKVQKQVKDMQKRLKHLEG